MMRSTFLTLAFATLFGGSALAQGVIVEHYDDDTGVVVTAPADEPAFVEEDDAPVIVEEAPPPERYQPPVYGWFAARPENCGTFRYWDGESCVDARFNPPRE